MARKANRELVDDLSDKLLEEYNALRSWTGAVKAWIDLQLNFVRLVAVNVSTF